MASMNAGLIHDGRGPDIMNALSQGARAAAITNAVQSKNALRQFYQQRGGDVLAGDREAINALAAMGSEGFNDALGIREAQQAQAHRDRSFALSQERLAMARGRFEAETAERAARMDEQERQRELEESRQFFSRMSEAYDAGPEAFATAESALPEDERQLGLTYDNWQQQKFVLEGYVTGLAKPDYVTINDSLVDRNAPGGPAVVPIEGLGQPKQSAAEAEIARLMETGLDRATAIKIMDGVWKTSQNPQTGEVQVIDMATGQPVSQAQPAAGAQPGSQPAQPAPELSFGDRYGASNRAFGAGGFLRSAVNAVGDTIGAGQAFPEVADTQSDFGVLRETLVNDLASGYNRQPPSWLLKQIQDLTPLAGSPLQGPAGAQDKLAALGRSVQQELESIQRQLNNRRLRPALKQELEGQAASLQKVIDRVTEAHGSFQSGGVELSPDIQERLRAYE